MSAGEDSLADGLEGGGEGGGGEALLQDQQREVLRQRLAERQRELEARQEKLKLLLQEQQNTSRTFGLAPTPGHLGFGDASAGDIGKNVASLMNEVMSSLENLPKPSPSASAAGGSSAGSSLAPPSGVPGASLPPGADASASSGKAGKGGLGTASTKTKQRRSATGGAAGGRGGSAADYDGGGGMPFKVTRGLPPVDTTIKPKVVESFDKSVQADLIPADAGTNDQPPSGSGSKDEIDDLSEEGIVGGGGGGTEVLLPEGRKENSKNQGESHAGKEGNKKKELNGSSEDAPKPLAPAVSEEERKKILQSPEFEHFFEKTTKVVERLLGQEELLCDPFVDYSGRQTSASDGSAEKIQHSASYSIAKLTSGRPILDVKASPHFPEVFLASYAAREFGGLAPDETEGCLLLWSLAMNQRPEYHFTCQSQVCTAIFDRFQPSMILGGTYAGSIVIWDTRAQSKPVQRTSLSSRGHAHPIYSMELVGTKNAHNLISVDTDGRLCVWSLQMLGAPTETLDLKRGNKEVCVECIAFTENEVNSLVLGSEDGSILQAYIHGNKPGVYDVQDSHGGAITSLSFHPAPAEPNQRDYTDLLLSTSVDWTIKLWSGKQSFSKPLQTFDNYEVYVYDAAWHPTHPALFGAVDGEGHVDLWNLVNDWETPAYRVGGSEGGGASSRPVAKNKLTWTSEGRRMVTGDAKGNVDVWTVAAEFLQPRGEDLAKFERRVAEAKPDNIVPGAGDIARDISFEFGD